MELLNMPAHGLLNIHPRRTTLPVFLVTLTTESFTL